MEVIILESQLQRNILQDGNNYLQLNRYIELDDECNGIFCKTILNETFDVPNKTRYLP